MSPRVDPAKRREQIVAAAFRLVVTSGLEGLSLRKVALESGLNIGSVRHYFDGQHDLLVAAATEAGNRMGRRLARHSIPDLRNLSGEAAFDAFVALVEEVLPVDAERHEEAIVVLELILAARTKPVFAAAAKRMGSDLTEVLTQAFTALRAREPKVQAALLSAFIGGASLDVTTPHGSLDATQLRVLLRAQLRTQLGSIDPAGPKHRG